MDGPSFFPRDRERQAMIQFPCYGAQIELTRIKESISGRKARLIGAKPNSQRESPFVRQVRVVWKTQWVIEICRDVAEMRVNAEACERQEMRDGPIPAGSPGAVGLESHALAGAKCVGGTSA